MDRDPLIDEQTEAARAEAARVGGGAPPEDPVAQAGGGEAEGFEQAEQSLIDAVEHGGARDPARDAFPAERETDRAGVEYGEADHEHSSEDVQ
ncbi:MAG: hypothetical protein NVSMB51_03770 [Solirubrobacteraceae bacterium]